MSALQQLEEKNKRGQGTELELCILMAGDLCAPEKAAEQLATLSTNCDNAIKANIEVAKLNVDLQEKIIRIEILVNKWHEQSNKNEMPTDRCIGFDMCADELSKSLRGES